MSQPVRPAAYPIVRRRALTWLSQREMVVEIVLSSSDDDNAGSRRARRPVTVAISDSSDEEPRAKSASAARPSVGHRPAAFAGPSSAQLAFAGGAARKSGFGAGQFPRRRTLVTKHGVQQPSQRAPTQRTVVKAEPDDGAALASLRALRSEDSIANALDPRLEAMFVLSRRRSREAALTVDPPAAPSLLMSPSASRRSASRSRGSRHTWSSNSTSPFATSTSRPTRRPRLPRPHSSSLCRQLSRLDRLSTSAAELSQGRGSCASPATPSFPSTPQTRPHPPSLPGTPSRTSATSSSDSQSSMPVRPVPRGSTRAPRR